VLTVNEKATRRERTQRLRFGWQVKRSASADARFESNFRRWAGELFWRVATNRYVFYGSLLLFASLVVGAITRQHEELWRTATALGIATVVIGLISAWLDTRSAGQTLLLRGKTRAKKS
jgi:hypothetical protein